MVIKLNRDWNVIGQLYCCWCWSECLLDLDVTEAVSDMVKTDQNDGNILPLFQNWAAAALDIKSSHSCCRHEQLSWTCSLHGNIQWGKYYLDFIPGQKLCKQPLHVCHQISSVTSFFLFMSTTAGVPHEWEYDSGHWPPGARSQPMTVFMILSKPVQGFLWIMTISLHCIAKQIM